MIKKHLKLNTLLIIIIFTLSRVSYAVDFIDTLRQPSISRSRLIEAARIIQAKTNDILSMERQIKILRMLQIAIKDGNPGNIDTSKVMLAFEAFDKQGALDALLEEFKGQDIDDAVKFIIKEIESRKQRAATEARKATEELEQLKKTYCISGEVIMNRLQLFIKFLEEKLIDEGATVIVIVNNEGHKKTIIDYFNATNGRGLKLQGLVSFKAIGSGKLSKIPNVTKLYQEMLGGLELWKTYLKYFNLRGAYELSGGKFQGLVRTIVKGGITRGQTFPPGYKRGNIGPLDGGNRNIVTVEQDLRSLQNAVLQEDLPKVTTLSGTLALDLGSFAQEEDLKALREATLEADYVKMAQLVEEFLGLVTLSPAYRNLIALQMALETSNEDKIAELMPNLMSDFKNLRSIGRLQEELYVFRQLVSSTTEIKDIEQAISHVLNNLAIEVADKGSIKLTANGLSVSLSVAESPYNSDSAVDLIKNLRALGWIDLDDFTESSDATFVIDRDKINIVAFKGEYVLSKPGLFIKKAIDLQKNRKKVVIVATSEEQKKKIEDLEPLDEAGDIYVTLLTGLEAGRWEKEILKEQPSYYFKNIPIHKIIENKELIAALKTAM